jgi:uncharacterized SAM-binding protein YcdF (DUF218 family)
MRGLWSFLCTSLGTLLAFALVVLFLIPPTRTLPAEILERNDHPAKGADAVVLLMGDAMDRVPHVASLYKKGYAGKILFVEAEETKLMEYGLRPLEGKMVYDYLTKKLNVPAGDIIFLEKTRVTSTQEEVKAIFKELNRSKFRTVILATSWYHSSRAAWIMNKFNSDRLRVESLPSPIPAKWYQSETDFLSVFNEYLKWAYYYVKYEVLA